MDHEYSSYRDGKYVDVPKIDKLCLILKDKFLRQEEENDYLREQNRQLKEGIWEKEEVKQLKEENKRLLKERYQGFHISDEEQKKIDEWISEREKVYTGAIGGRYEYRFFPTGIGTVGRIVDTLKDESFTFKNWVNYV